MHAAQSLRELPEEQDRGAKQTGTVESMKEWEIL